MKKIILLVGFLLFFVSGSVLSVPATFISPAQISSGGFFITAPGLYVLTDDVDYTIADGTAITILSNDVLLDMNGKTILNAGVSVESGISLASTLTNVTVKNGALRVFDGNGISMNAGCVDINFENITIVGLSSTMGTGFNFFGTQNSTLRTSNVVLDNCNVSNCSFGVTATATDAVNIFGSSFNRNTVGVSGTDCKGWQIEASQASFNNATAMSAFGLSLSSCACWIIRNSDFSGNESSFAAAGVSVSAGTSNGGYIFENCMFCNNQSNGAFMAQGLEMLNSSSSVITNCTFNGNISVGDGANGLSLTGSAVLIQNCVASGNAGASTGVARGIVVTGTAYTILDCEAANNFARGSGAAAGILITSGTGCLIENCVAIANQSGSGTVRGIATLLTAKSLVKNCISKSNAGSSGATSIGFQGSDNAGDVLFVGNIAFGQATNYFGSVIPFLTLPAAGPYPAAPTFDERDLANLSFT